MHTNGSIPNKHKSLMNRFPFVYGFAYWLFMARALWTSSWLMTHIWSILFGGYHLVGTVIEVQVIERHVDGTYLHVFEAFSQTFGSPDLNFERIMSSTNSVKILKQARTWLHMVHCINTYNHPKLLMCFWSNVCQRYSVFIDGFTFLHVMFLFFFHSMMFDLGWRGKGRGW